MVINRRNACVLITAMVLTPNGRAGAEERKLKDVGYDLKIKKTDNPPPQNAPKGASVRSSADTPSPPKSITKTDKKK